MLYKLWRDTPVPLTIAFYVFDLVNENEFVNGNKPHLVQRGPFVYKYDDKSTCSIVSVFSSREQRTKDDVRFYSNGTISYRESRRFTFDRSRSSNDETFRIKTINILYMVSRINIFHDQ
jgi:scavenger receptor class B, member 1